MQDKKGGEELKSVTLEISQLRKIETQGFIGRVLEPLRNVNSKAYEPQILAIGPYHHGKEKYNMMEEHKLLYLQSILKRKETSAKRYISVVSKLEEKARSYYAQPVKLNREKFIKMLVVDACFIIELMLKFKQKKSGYRDPNDPIFTVKLICSRLKRDMILFENQIPFFILCELFELIEGPNQYNRLINLFLNFFKYLFPDHHYRKLKNRNPPHVKYLLDLIYHCWTPESFDGAIDLNEEYPITVNSESRFIPSAIELQDANVKFKKREPCDSLFDVKFQKGTLLIPSLIIHDNTECFLRNLIALEQYYGYDEKKHVGAYLKFMDLLINSSKDVDVLTQSGIIYNSVGDNEVIVSMFNKLMSSVAASSKHAYGKTFTDINTFRDKRRNRWMAVLNRDYLSSPWGFISIFAASILLILTIIQTVCSILQVVYK